MTMCVLEDAKWESVTSCGGSFPDRKQMVPCA